MSHCFSDAFFHRVACMNRIMVHDRVTRIDDLNPTPPAVASGSVLTQSPRITIIPRVSALRGRVRAWWIKLLRGDCLPSLVRTSA